MKHAADRLEDPPFVSQLKENARNFLAEKFEIFPFHGVAMLLHPKMKSLRGIDADKREGIYQETRKLLKSHEGVSPPSTTQTERSALADEPLKKKRNQQTTVTLKICFLNQKMMNFRRIYRFLQY
jgi:hypothetical protein